MLDDIPFFPPNSAPYAQRLHMRSTVCILVASLLCYFEVILVSPHDRVSTVFSKIDRELNKIVLGRYEVT